MLQGSILPSYTLNIREGKNKIILLLRLSRISLVFGYGPANSFQPQKTVLKTMQRVDTFHQMANYEFFREKVWQGMSMYFATKIKKNDIFYLVMFNFVIE